MTEIALASGFGSLRRFNAAFRDTYERAPSALRRLRGDGAAGGELALRLAFRQPYDLDHLLGFLAARALPGVERVDREGYARTVAVEGGAAIVRVRLAADAPGARRRGREAAGALELRIDGAPPSALFRLTADARRVFDLSADPGLVIAGTFAGDPLLGPLVRRRPGLRIPGAWDPFECAVRAVLGQQVSVAAGRTLAPRLVARAGSPLAAPRHGLTHLFPSPAALAASDLSGARPHVGPGPHPARDRARGRGRPPGPALRPRGRRRAPAAARRRRRLDGAVRRAAGAGRAGRVSRGRPRAETRGGTSRPRRSPPAPSSSAPRPGDPGGGTRSFTSGRPRPREAARGRHVRMENEMRYDVIETPIGPLTVAADDAGLRRIFFPSARGGARAGGRLGARRGAVRRARARARRVLRGHAAARSRSRSRPRAPTFQLATWRALTEIPYGTTISYAELARRIGRPAASRAVGAANGANPLPIVVPCHRVIGADGSLTGFGGGLPLKRALLELERAACVAPPRQLRLV